MACLESACTLEAVGVHGSFRPSVSSGRNWLNRIALSKAASKGRVAAVKGCRACCRAASGTPSLQLLSLPRSSKASRRRNQDSHRTRHLSSPRRPHAVVPAEKAIPCFLSPLFLLYAVDLETTMIYMYKRTWVSGAPWELAANGSDADTGKAVR